MVLLFEIRLARNCYETDSLLETVMRLTSYIII